MDDLFRWSSPASSVVHAGRILQMKTVCGLGIGPLGSGWQALGYDNEIDCVNCLRVVGEVGDRPSSVSIDARGNRTVRA